MGFFKDFKRDFAQAVNELMPDKDELANEYDDEDMVNTFDESDNMEIAPEDMLEDLDDFSGNSNDYTAVSHENDNIYDDLEDMEKTEENEEDALGRIPDAEVISEPNDVGIEDFGEKNLSDSIMVEMTDEERELLGIGTRDELEEVDTLDNEDMQENIPDALLTEGQPESFGEDLKDVDLDKAVEDAIMKQDEANIEEDNMEDNNPNLIENNVNEKEQDMESILADDTTYITKGTTIKGDIETDGSIDVIGSVEGNVTCGGKLIVGGSVTGNIDAGELYANAAKIEGEIVSSGSIKIGVGSVVVGNVSATSAVIAGAVNGDIDVQGPVIVDSTAVIMGNIKSRSVQINNGAVIEGFCSQCYSEIDVKSFFE